MQAFSHTASAAASWISVADSKVLSKRRLMASK